MEIFNFTACLNCGVWNEGWASVKEERDESEVTCLEEVAKECRWRSLLILSLCSFSCLTFSITHCICISRFMWIGLTLKCFSEPKELIVYIEDSTLPFLLLFFFFLFSFKWQGMLWESRAAVHLVISTGTQGCLQPSGQSEALQGCRGRVFWVTGRGEARMVGIIVAQNTRASNSSILETVAWEGRA